MVDFGGFYRLNDDSDDSIHYHDRLPGAMST